jgi:hypothetical protein
MVALQDWRKVLDGPFVGQPHVGADLAIASTSSRFKFTVALYRDKPSSKVKNIWHW